MDKNQEKFVMFWKELFKQKSFRWMVGILVILPIIVFFFCANLRTYLWKLLPIYISICICILPLYIQIFKEIRKNNMELKRKMKIRKEDKEDARKEQFSLARPFFSIDYGLHEQYQTNSQFFTDEFDPEVFSSHLGETENQSADVYGYYCGFKRMSLLINNYSDNPMLAVKVEFIMKDSEEKETAYIDRIDPSSKILIYSKNSEKDYVRTSGVSKKSIEPGKINIYFVSKLNEKIQYEYSIGKNFKARVTKVLKKSEGNDIPLSKYNPERVIESHSLSYYFPDKLKNND